MDPSNDNQPISVDPDERLTDDQETATGLDESGEVEQDSRRISVSSAGMELKDDDALNQSSDFLLKNSRTHPVMISPGENGTSFSGNSSGVVSVDDSVDDVDRLSSYIRSENSIWVRTGNLNRGGDEWRGSPEDGGKITDGDEDQFEQVSLKDPQESNAASESASEADSVRTPMQEKGSLGFEDLNFANTRAGKEFSPDGQNIQEDLLGSPASQKSLNYSPQSFSPSFNNVPCDGGSGFSSPICSPSKDRSKPVLPSVSPELMHLIDSAIQEASHSSSLQRLRRIVGGKESLVEEEEENEYIPKLVVDVLLAKMGGVEALDDIKENSAPTVMLSAGAAIVAAELIPWLPYEGDTNSYMSPRTRLVKGLSVVLRSCTRNRAMTSAAGLLKVLLTAANTIFTTKVEGSEKDQAWDDSPLCECLEILGAHSLSVFNLRSWLQIITDAIPTGKALNLTLALERAMSGKETKGPACTFEFDGESSGLLGSGESRWPFSTGYAFVTWLYIESFADTLNAAAAAAGIAAAAAAKSGKSSAMSAAAAASALAGEGTAHMPRLFSFISADNQGVEAYFHGQFLVIESGSAKGKKASLHFTYAFKPQCWYFIGLEHTCKQSILGKSESELKLYVDGHLYESRLLEFPRISKSLAFCCIGTNPPPTIAGLQRRRRQCPLFAEMGPIYIFKEPIGQDRMARLASRGGDAVPSFGNGAGFPCSATSEHVMALAEESAALDAEIGPKLHLLYHPKLLVGRSCSDASPAGAAGIKNTGLLLMFSKEDKYWSFEMDDKYENC